MKTELDCLPCIFRQVRRTLEYAGVNGDKGRMIMREAEAILQTASLDTAPARISTLIHRLIRRETRLDPYRTLKQKCNHMSLGLLPLMREIMRGAADPLDAGVRLAIAGNVIDFGIYDGFDLERSIQDSLRLPIPHTHFNSFSRALKESRRILYLCDNAGEIVFDRVLIELIRDMGTNVTAVVKGSPVINDATAEDAASAGLYEVAAVIDNGSDGIGTLLEACSEGFSAEYTGADMVISKGQANYETLTDEKDKRIFFLFKVKCPVVARTLGRPEGDIVLMENQNTCLRR